MILPRRLTLSLILLNLGSHTLAASSQNGNPMATSLAFRLAWLKGTSAYLSSLPSLVWWKRKDIASSQNCNHSRTSILHQFEIGNGRLAFQTRTARRKRNKVFPDIVEVVSSKEHFEFDEEVEISTLKGHVDCKKSFHPNDETLHTGGDGSEIEVVNNELEAKNDISGSIKSNTTSTLYTFHYPPSNITLRGLSVSMPQFKSWIEYRLQRGAEKKSFPRGINPIKFVTEKDIDTGDNEVRSHLRKDWFDRRLLSHRTEVLTVYPSNAVASKDVKEGSKNKGKVKRGGFEDLLSVYTDRLVGIIQEEAENPLDSFDIKAWLQDEYGAEETDKLSFANFGKLKADEQLEQMKHFLDWFRAKFPYYYDKCDSCGSSYRDDTNNQDTSIIDEKDDDDSVLKGSFLGYNYPEDEEVAAGKASRTEIYQCHKCGTYTRFPRFNSVQHIVQNGGKGRCGEYSILMFRVLRTLGIQARWVVDWSDHVWAEYLGADGRWVHVDPCEAAIDHPLLYEEWGKKQVFIIAFFAPLTAMGVDHGMDSSLPPSSLSNNMFVEDVTLKYTSATRHEIAKRREEHIDTSTAIAKAETKLKKALSEQK